MGSKIRVNTESNSLTRCWTYIPNALKKRSPNALIVLDNFARLFIMTDVPRSTSNIQLNRRPKLFGLVLQYPGMYWCS